MSINESKDLQKVTLKNITILFSNLNDPKYGNQITLDVTDEGVQEAIRKFYLDNKFAKEPAFKKYVSPKTNQTTVQWSVKLSKFLTFYTPFGDELKLESLTSADIERGTKISTVIYAYDYKNNFGEGVTCAATIIASKGRPVTSSREDDLKEIFE